jgi:hypothetical protein
MDPEGERFKAELGLAKVFDQMPLWVKGITILEKYDLIFTWS